MASDDITNTVQDEVDEPAAKADNYDAEAKETPAELALIKKLQKTIKGDKQHHKDAFAQMRVDMFMARTGRDKTYPATSYTANLCGRHVKAKTAALYAKNPKAVAKRRETMDFRVWDENPQSLQMAMQTITMATQMMAQVAPAPVDSATGAPAIDPTTGAPMAAPASQIPPEMEQAFTAAHSLIADFQQGMERRTQIDKIGKTLEILFAQALREQKPLDFKMAMKQLVRRTCTTGVGYVELGFQRKYGPRPGMTEKLSDARSRLDHMKRLAERIGDVEDPIMPDDPEIAELQKSVEALQNEPEIVLREGLIVDFPQSTKVIPDRLCKSLVGFVGARHVTIEYMFTVDQVKEMFGKDVGTNYVGYQSDGQMAGEASANVVADEESEPTVTKDKGSGLVCVWKHFDKVSGLVYFLADGYKCFLREPAGPDVFVEDFWPVYALTFNAVEDESSLFPPSDVFLMRDQQMDYNRSRQGMREHRKAARPRWAYPNGSLENADIELLKRMQAFDAVGLNFNPEIPFEKVLQVVPVPGVDPNLYETGQLFTDVQMVVGSSEAQFGGTAQATATESAIAANSSASSDGASVDDLDAFLTVIARSSGQILLKEMSEEQVMTIVGPGALWPHLTLEEIANELFLEVEAGSSGKPNQAIQVQNFKELAPLIMQIPGVSPHWLAKEAITRLDDRIDLTQAIASGIPSIVAQNAMTQIAPAPGPEGAPADQGAKGAEGGAANGPPAPADQQQGSEPAFGSNQV